MKQPRDDLESMVGYRLKQTQSALRSRMDEALRPLNLTTPQYSCLEAIERHPGSSNSEIARRVFVSRQTMSTLLRGLQQRGLVARADRSTAGRALPLSVTDAGRRVLDEAVARIAPIERAMAESMKPEQREALMDGLLRCVEALDAMDDCDPAAPTSADPSVGPQGIRRTRRRAGPGNGLGDP